MAHTQLMAENVREFFQASTLVEYLVAHPALGVAVVVGILAAYGCSEIAMGKGRNDRLWGTLGLLFSVVPLIVLIALPSIKPTPQPDIG
ncbi:hypothetical protein [Mycobacterium sp. MMS18-G62]